MLSFVLHPIKFYILKFCLLDVRPDLLRPGFADVHAEVAAHRDRQDVEREREAVGHAVELAGIEIFTCRYVGGVDNHIASPTLL